MIEARHPVYISKCVMLKSPNFDSYLSVAQLPATAWGSSRTESVSVGKCWGGVNILSLDLSLSNPSQNQHLSTDVKM